MKIGLGLPTVFPADDGKLVLKWAVRADEAGFSTISIIDRLVYENYEPVVTLAAVAAVTNRIRLMTSVVIAPLRNAGVLAKEAATIDVISGGRLTLGLGVGNRQDDFAVAPEQYSGRGQWFTEQLRVMKQAWSGKAMTDSVGPIGPVPVQPGGPELLIGGRAAAALKRAARWSDGYVTGSLSDVSGARATFDVVAEEWQALGKSGQPRFVGSLLCAIGKSAAEITMAEQSRYYAWQGGPPGNAPGLPGRSSTNRKTIPHTVEQIRAVLDLCESAGMDEVILRPGVTDLDQVDRLAVLIR